MKVLMIIGNGFNLFVMIQLSFEIIKMKKHLLCRRKDFEKNNVFLLRPLDYSIWLYNLFFFQKKIVAKEIKKCYNNIKNRDILVYGSYSGFLRGRGFSLLEG